MSKTSVIILVFLAGLAFSEAAKVDVAPNAETQRHDSAPAAPTEVEDWELCGKGELEEACGVAVCIPAVTVLIHQTSGQFAFDTPLALSASVCADHLLRGPPGR